MHMHSSILLASLLVTGLAANFSKVEYHSQEVLQFDSAQQKLSTIDLNQPHKDAGCEQSDEKSPKRGCGRRDTNEID